MHLLMYKTSVDSDQSVHPSGMISVYAACYQNLWLTLKHIFCQQSVDPDQTTDVPADLGLLMVSYMS